MAIKRKRPPKRKSRIPVRKSVSDTVKQTTEQNDANKNSDKTIAVRWNFPGKSRTALMHYTPQKVIPKKEEEDTTTKVQTLNTKRDGQFSQLSLITMACGDMLKGSMSEDDPWFGLHPGRNALRKKTNSEMFKVKSNPKYHRNNFHHSLQDKWSKIMTNKISAFAFSRSLKGRHANSSEQ